MKGPAAFAVALALGVLLAAPSLGTAGKRNKRGPSSDWTAQAVEVLHGRALQSEVGWELLVELCDRIGHRLSGSPQLDRAVDWAVDRLSQAGVDEVSRQPVMVPRWVRGAESLQLLEPVDQPLAMLGLGGSVATPPEGIEAYVVVVGSFEELEALGREAIEGRIVLFNVPFTTYGETVRYRVGGPSKAAALGASAALVRSVTPVSLDTPHTGVTRYDEGHPKIPAAAITVEGAERFQRLRDRGVPIRVRLAMEARTEGDVPSANVIADVKGREFPDEVVLVSCHLDSWDVGQGAQDDGGGCVMAMETLRLIASLDHRPRRTVRAVLFTNEENGLRGGSTYAEEQAGKKLRHVAVMEADIGAGAPMGWRLDLQRPEGDPSDEDFARAEAALEPIRAALRPLGADGLRRGFSGADISPLVRAGVPGLGLDMDRTGYWPIHHTEADTIDKIDPMVLRRDIATMAITAFLLAEMPQTLGPEPEN